MDGKELSVMSDVTNDSSNCRELDEEKEVPLSESKGRTFKCKMCEEDHWTSQCPYTDDYKPLLDLQDKLQHNVNARGEPASTPGDLEKKKSCVYVPPALRGDTGEGERRGETMNTSRQGEKAATLLVRNLSENASASDLKDLFSPFGLIARIHLAKDKNTNSFQGFAFVSYYKREDAARALQSMHGHGHDHLILNVEWATPPSN